MNSERSATGGAEAVGAGPGAVAVAGGDALHLLASMSNPTSANNSARSGSTDRGSHNSSTGGIPKASPVAIGMLSQIATQNSSGGM